MAQIGENPEKDNTEGKIWIILLIIIWGDCIESLVGKHFGENEYCHTNNILLYRLNYKMNNTEIEKQIDNIIQNPVTITA